MPMKRAALIALLAAPSLVAAADGLVREVPGQRAHYDAAGNLVRAEFDDDRDGRFEARETYRDGARTGREEDLDGDGRWERRFRWEADGSASCVEDPGTGPVRTTRFGPDGQVRRVEEDADRDGRPESSWSYGGGALVAVEKPGGRWHYEAGALRRAELDADRDGRPERVEHYGPGDRLERVEEFTKAGAPGAVWEFDAKGDPSRMQEDADGDGRLECTRTWMEGGHVERRVDGNGDGRPEVREVYAADGALVLREEDLDADGRFDVRESRAKE